MSTKSPRRAGLGAILGGVTALAALVSAGDAHAGLSTMKERYNDAIRGGVVVDAWAGVSTTTTTVGGSVQVVLPVGAKVVKAFLVSSTGSTEPGKTPGDLSPVAGNQRQVVIGSGANTATFKLEGTPNDVVPDTGYGSFTNDVTAVVSALVPTGTGAPVVVPLVERGDGPVYYQGTIYGHTLVVVYSDANAPLRNVIVASGGLGGPDQCRSDASQTFALKRPTAKCGEPYPLSVTIPDDPFGGQENSTIRVNGTTITTHAGGWDDHPAVTSGQVGGLPSLLACMTAGSFGAPAGKPVGLSKTFADGVALTDVISGPLAADDPRGDDELYDLEPLLARGSTSVTVRFSNPTDCDYVSALVVQTAAACTTSCGVDADCDAGEFCNDAPTPTICAKKLANGAAIPGGAAAGKCNATTATRICASGRCETSDDKCGLLDGATCAAAAECRSGACTANKCGSGGPTDAGVDASPADAGADATSPVDAGSPGVDASAPSPSPTPSTPNDGASLEGGGLGCSATNAAADATAMLPLLGVAGIILASRRRRHSKKG